ncbi:MAG: NUDIX hydrolase [Alphaproteobacteria bacterium]
MPHRQPLLQLLQAHTPWNTQEAAHLAATVAFVEAEPDCFKRELLKGHVTGSVWVTDKACTKVLLNHHKSLNLWMNFGGHCDGDPDVLAVARRELEEEAGIAHATFIPSIMDVDTHRIPERIKNGKLEPEHTHYDIMFHAWVERDDFVLSEESLNIQWVPLTEAMQVIGHDPYNTYHMGRLIQKALVYGAKVSA